MPGLPDFTVLKGTVNNIIHNMNEKSNWKLHNNCEVD